MQTETPPKQAVITVSGLCSGIGKTTLCRHIVGRLPGVGAVKVTINDRTTEVLDDDASIMVAGKDTWLLKTGGASPVVWVRAQQERLHEALAEALVRCRGCERLLVEGSSILGHITPCLSFFLCDERICTGLQLKPSRVLALEKADIIIHNLRPGGTARAAAVEQKIRLFNERANVHALDVSDPKRTAVLLDSLLHEYGIASHR